MNVVTWSFVGNSLWYRNSGSLGVGLLPERNSLGKTDKPVTAVWGQFTRPKYYKDGRILLNLRSMLSPFTHLIDPQFAHDNVVHCRGNFLPSVVVPSCVEDTVDAT